MNSEDNFPMQLEVEVDPIHKMKLPGCPPVQVAFGYHAKPNEHKSKEAGHDVFEEVEYVRIAIPGDQKSLYFQPATDSYRERFPDAYRAFKQRATEAPVVGTPIESWPQVNRALALTLKAANIPTIEALASVSDSLVTRIGSNGRELRAKAQAWLDNQRGTADSAKAAAEKQAMQDQIDALTRQIQGIAQAQKDGALPAEMVGSGDIAEAVRRPRSGTKAGSKVTAPA